MADSPAYALPRLVQAPSPNHSTRGGARVDLLVLHESAGSYSGGVAWLRNPVSQASTHLFLREDGRECSQLVPLAQKAWTQGSKWNPRSVSLELANVTAKGYHSERQLRTAARIFGWLAIKYAIGPRWARAGVGRGVVFHGNLPDSGGHPFCGPSEFDFGRFMEMLGDEIARGEYRKTWAK